MTSSPYPTQLCAAPHICSIATRTPEPDGPTRCARLWYRLVEQLPGVSPVSVALDHTSLRGEGSCAYASVQPVRRMGQKRAGIKELIREILKPSSA